jgi:hypothetical protein
MPASGLQAPEAGASPAPWKQWRQWRPRLESSDLGRMLLSAFIIVTLAGIAVWNLPGSALRDRLVPLVRPYFHGVGLDQGWGVFAPDPRSITNDFVALLDYPDGTEVTWRYARGDPTFGAYRTYRWQKWSEHVTLDEQELLAPAARWLASTQVYKGQHPTRVILVQRWYTIAPPGKTQAPAWQQKILYTLDTRRP